MDEERKEKPKHFEEARQPRDPALEDTALIDPAQAEDGSVPVDYDFREEHHAGRHEEEAGDEGEDGD